MKNNNSKVIKAVVLMVLVWGQIAQPMLGRGRFGRLATRWGLGSQWTAVMVAGMQEQGFMPINVQRRTKWNQADGCPFEHLGLDNGVTKQQIKKAYYKKTHEVHPDVGGSDEDFKKLHDAYEACKTGEIDFDDSVEHKAQKYYAEYLKFENQLKQKYTEFLDEDGEIKDYVQCYPTTDGDGTAYVHASDSFGFKLFYVLFTQAIAQGDTSKIDELIKDHNQLVTIAEQFNSFHRNPFSQLYSSDFARSNLAYFMLCYAADTDNIEIADYIARFVTFPCDANNEIGMQVITYESLKVIELFLRHTCAVHKGFVKTAIEKREDALELVKVLVRYGVCLEPDSCNNPLDAIVRKDNVFQFVDAILDIDSSYGVKVLEGVVKLCFLNPKTKFEVGSYLFEKGVVPTSDVLDSLIYRFTHDRYYDEEDKQWYSKLIKLCLDKGALLVSPYEGSDFELVNLLVQYNIPVVISNVSNIDTVRFLLEQKAPISSAAVANAISYDKVDIDMINLLLDHGAATYDDQDYSDLDDWKQQEKKENSDALAKAVLYNYPKVFYLLVQRGAHVSSYAMECALKKGNYELFDALRNMNAPLPDRDRAVAAFGLGLNPDQDTHTRHEEKFTEQYHRLHLRFTSKQAYEIMTYLVKAYDSSQGVQLDIGENKNCINAPQGSFLGSSGYSQSQLGGQSSNGFLDK